MTAQPENRTSKGLWREHPFALATGAVLIAAIAAVVTNFATVKLAPNPAELSTQAADVSTVANHALEVIERLVNQSSGVSNQTAAEAQQAVQQLKNAGEGLSNSFKRMAVNKEIRESARAFLADYYLGIGQAIQLGPDRIPFAVTQKTDDGLTIWTRYASRSDTMNPGDQVISGSGNSQCRVSYLGQSSAEILAFSVKCGVTE